MQLESVGAAVLVGLLAAPSLMSVGDASEGVLLSRVSTEAAATAAPKLTQTASAAAGGTAARVAGRVATELAQVSTELRALGDVADVAHYASVPRRLESPYFNGDVIRAMNLRMASGTNAPGFDMARKVAQDLQQGLSPEAIANAAGRHKTVRMLADVIEDVRQHYGAGEFDAHDFAPSGYWDWNELDHVLHYIAEPLEPHARWAGAGPDGWLQGESAGRFALAPGAEPTALQRRLDTYRNLFRSKGVSDAQRLEVFPEVDQATRFRVRRLKNDLKSLTAQAQAEELQELSQAFRFLSPTVRDTLKRLLGGSSDDVQAQRALLLAALAGDVDLVELTPSQIAARIRRTAR